MCFSARAACAALNWSYSLVIKTVLSQYGELSTVRCLRSAPMHCLYIQEYTVVQKCQCASYTTVLPRLVPTTTAARSHSGETKRCFRCKSASHAFIVRDCPQAVHAGRDADPGTYTILLHSGERQFFVDLANMQRCLAGTSSPRTRTQRAVYIVFEYYSVGLRHNYRFLLPIAERGGAMRNLQTFN